MLVNSYSLLRKAQMEGCAVAALNIENMEMAQAVVAAAEELNRPIIIQTTPSTVKYGTLPVYTGLVTALAKNSKVEIALHLDHGSSYELCEAALREGYTSVMIDGSRLSLEDNMELTRKVIDICAPRAVSVEAELGIVGGKEDDLVANGSTSTDPNMARAFVQGTGVSALAIAIGTAHGFYQGTPVLDKECLKKIHDTVDVPLVLHGASGLSEEDVKDCIRLGITKVNFATELRVAYTEGVREALADPDVFDPKAYGKAGIAKVKALAMEKIRICSLM